MLLFQIKQEILVPQSSEAHDFGSSLIQDYRYVNPVGPILVSLVGTSERLTGALLGKF